MNASCVRKIPWGCILRVEGGKQMKSHTFTKQEKHLQYVWVQWKKFS